MRSLPETYLDTLPERTACGDLVVNHERICHNFATCGKLLAMCICMWQGSGKLHHRLVVSYYMYGWSCHKFSRSGSVLAKPSLNPRDITALPQVCHRLLQTISRRGSHKQMNCGMVFEFLSPLQCFYLDVVMHHPHAST